MNPVEQRIIYYSCQSVRNRIGSDLFNDKYKGLPHYLSKCNTYLTENMESYRKAINNVDWDLIDDEVRNKVPAIVDAVKLEYLNSYLSWELIREAIDSIPAPFNRHVELVFTQFPVSFGLRVKVGKVCTKWSYCEVLNDKTIKQTIRTLRGNMDYISYELAQEALKLKLKL